MQHRRRLHPAGFGPNESAMVLVQHPDLGKLDLVANLFKYSSRDYVRFVTDCPNAPQHLLTTATFASWKGHSDAYKRSHLRFMMALMEVLINARLQSSRVPWSWVATEKSLGDP